MEGLREVRELGRGTFAVALLVERGGQNYVLKKVNLRTPTSVHTNHLQEVQLLRALKHPHIVAYQDCKQVGQELHLLLEYCAGGDLHLCIQQERQRNQHFPEDTVRTWLRQLADALQYLHGRNVLHRDIKPMNIFLTENRDDVKLGDFGLSRVLDSQSFVATSILGTLPFMAPEMFSQNPQYDSKADMWALGCSVFEVATFKLSHHCADRSVGQRYSASLQQLVDALLQRDPERRPSAAEVLRHSFLIQVRVVVKDLSGNMVSLHVSTSITVHELKQQLAKRNGVPPDSVSLVKGGKTLQDAATLASCGVVQGSNLQLTHKYVGGHHSRRRRLH